MTVETKVTDDQQMISDRYTLTSIILSLLFLSISFVGNTYVFVQEIEENPIALEESLNENPGAQLTGNDGTDDNPVIIQASFNDHWITFNPSGISPGKISTGKKASPIPLYILFEQLVLYH